ncbi:MAG: filamentous hemagglutinin N-terminal domain-containing protein [Comamonadaceae bacterium]
MNKSYRLIYNEITNTWVAAAETAKGRGKRSSGAVLLAAAAALMPLLQTPAWAAPPNPAISSAPAPTQLPTGGQVVAGQANISQSAATLNVNQSSNRAAIDWATFNVGSQAQVNFKQPSASSVTLNRVLDANPSQIFGRISANGQVFLSNPSGVYFSPTST